MDRKGIKYISNKTDIPKVIPRVIPIMLHTETKREFVLTYLPR